MQILDEINTLLQEAATAQARLTEIRDKIISYHPALQKIQEHTHVKVNDYYHIIELADANAVTLIKATTGLRSVLRQRRDVKEAFIVIQMLKDRGKVSYDAKDILERSAERVARYKQEANQSVQTLQLV